MNNLTIPAFKAMRLTCPWSVTRRHEQLMDVLGVNMSRYGMCQQKAWDMYITARAGLVWQVATIGRTWAVYDCPTWGDRILHFEVTSLSAN